jgi:hypothetical protein
LNAQRINAAGAIQWAAGGVVICVGTVTDQAPESLVSDGNGGCIVTWNDWRNTDGDDIYAQRLNASGEIQWALNGVVVCNAAAYQLSTVITTDGSGGAIICWQDGRSNINTEIYAQKINASGVIQWPVNGILVNSVTTGSFYQQIIPEAGGAIISWTDKRNGNSDWNIYAQKINSTGVIQWAINGVAASLAAGNQNFSQLTTDGAGGMICTWDEVQGVITNPEIYAQKINAGGAIQWGENGVAVCLMVNAQHYPEIAADGSGGAVITWHDHRINIQDIYAQRLNAAGNVQWTSNGVAVSTAANGQIFPGIVNAVNGMIISWEDWRNDVSGNRRDVFAQRINLDGTLGTSAVPVSLLNFEGKKLNKNIQLHWQTSSELNSDYFSIERSNNGTQFATIGKIDAAGNSNLAINYYFIDSSTGSINFYRLRQVDRDGKFSYSSIIKIESNASALLYTLSPNPAKDFIIISSGSNSEMLSISIYDELGRRVWQQSFRNSAHINISLHNLNKGLYFIRLYDGGTMEKIKFLKQ